LFVLNFLGFELHLLGEKAAYRPETNTLYVADTHFGKAGTFRRGGVPLPGGHNAADYQRLNNLIGRLMPERIVFLGDLFHSDINAEWRDFTEWRKLHPDIGMILIQGNHDILDSEEYRQAGLEVHLPGFSDSGLMLNHHPRKPEDVSKETKPALCGHVHPGVRLTGPGRQYEKLPCFWLSSQFKQLMLPAFGSFTGLGIIAPSEDDGIYVAASGQVVEV